MCRLKKLLETKETPELSSLCIKSIDFFRAAKDAKTIEWIPIG